jgi:hypothetical protein
MDNMFSFIAQKERQNTKDCVIFEFFLLVKIYNMIFWVRDRVTSTSEIHMASIFPLLMVRN